ncbi:GmrSD restriction endonuclease domain-containing protein [Brachybacterium sp. 107]|uniref:GmrSD restriction endonuclease domain-containing protein n=1 Tax=Brachybacterium sp. 107 TaxID=3457736 RepID=UPI004033977D
MPTDHPAPKPPSGNQGWPSAPSFGQPQEPGFPQSHPGAHSAPGPHGFREPQRPRPEPGKNYAVAWALSLFLGVWGVDRFYLGRWKTGLLKFLTMGGLFLWYLIDLVLLLTGTVKDAKGRPLQQYDTVKWPSRVISGVVAVGFVAMMAIAGSIDTPTTPPQPEAVVAEAAADEDQQAPTDTAAQTPAATEPSEEPTTEAVPTTTPAPEPTTPEPSPTPETVEAADGTALAMLAGLDEKGRAPKTDYDRDSFGWRDDVDRNGCDTRNDILRRDLHEISLKGGTNGCIVQLGSLKSPYSGDTVDFDRANSTIDIDHVVALSDAWQTGAAQWDEDTRVAFANDPLNLLAVESGLNRQKGDGDAATWLPPKKDYRCEYVARQIAVKDKYELWVKPAEADAMRDVLANCDGFAAIEDDGSVPAAGEGDVVGTWEEPAPKPAPKPAPAPTTAPAPAPKPASTEDSGSNEGSVYYKNCDAARAAGAAPVHKGEPGYAKHLDRDGDGVGCDNG